MAFSPSTLNAMTESFIHLSDEVLLNRFEELTTSIARDHNKRNLGFVQNACRQEILRRLKRGQTRPQHQ